MASGVSALDVRAGLLARGVIARPLGTTTIAFCPPLVIDDDDLGLCLTALGEALGEALGRTRGDGRADAVGVRPSTLGQRVPQE